MKCLSRYGLLVIAFIPTISRSALAITYTAMLLPTPIGYGEAEARRGDGTYAVGRIGVGSGAAHQTHAILWGPSGTIDLNPIGYATSFAVDIDSGQQVGWGRGPGTNNYDRALLWAGTAESVIDLTPSGYASAIAYGVSGTNQVGWATSSALDHAFLWSGSSNSAVTLHPAGIYPSRAYDVSGNSQVGYVAPGHIRAVLWHGTADSIIDLNPTECYRSFARAVDGSVQGGSGTFTASNQTHALLWHGSAASALDLNPPGFKFSAIEDIRGDIQVGFGNTAIGSGDSDHALVWNGTAESFIDLHQFLPKSYRMSRALGIGTNGVIIGHAYDGLGKGVAVIWSPVPEPSAAGLAAFVMIGIIVLDFRRSMRASCD